MPVPTKPATAATAAANRAALTALAFDDDQDFADVRRGLIAPLADNGVIRDAAGELVWDLAWFSFPDEDGPAPDSVHPSLWRQSRLISEAGLYEVVERIYQVRNHDLANVTIIADPHDTAAARLQADAYEQLGYQAEGPQWRNLYLTAAQELRDGIPTTGVQSTGSIETVMAMPLDLFLDYTAVRLNGPKAGDTTLTINLDLADGDQPGPHALQLATLTALLDDFTPYFSLTSSNA